MDRASIRGDAIEYMKELLKKINDLHNELKSMPPTAPASSLHHPLTPTNNNTATLPAAPSLPSRMMIKETTSCPTSSLPTPNDHPAREHKLILMSNYQTETDPAVIALLIEKRAPHLAKNMTYVAGDRVVTDPMCKPFSI
ncbi:hypothetical protein S245_024673, partial [Arachis hypogaea]